MDVEHPGEHGPVRALLFDLGGVVINFDFGGAFRLWASRAGCEPSELAERFAIDEPYEQHERGEIPASTYFAALRHSLAIDLPDEDFVEGWNDVYLGVIPGMSETLSVAQRHVPLYAFTNSNPTHKSVWEHLYASDLQPFAAVFVSSDIGARKPDPDAFILVATRMGCAPEDVLFFDDAPENIEGARAAGMRGVVVTSIRDVHRALSRIGIEIDI